jgi:hypothetical protein
MEHGGGSIMLWRCFATGGTGALYKIDGVIRKENDVAILKQHLKTSVRKFNKKGIDVYGYVHTGATVRTASIICN